MSSKQEVKTVLPLALVIKKNGFLYHQEYNSEYAAIYRQEKNGERVGYEVFKKSVQQAFSMNGYSYPAKQRFPCNEDFGKTAWSVATLERAQYKAKEIENKKVSKMELV